MANGGATSAAAAATAAVTTTTAITTTTAAPDFGSPQANEADQAALGFMNARAAGSGVDGTNAPMAVRGGVID